MSDRVALVTGASRGIGQAIARQLARDGMLVVINYHKNQAPAEETLESITSENGRAVIRRFDVADVDQVTECVKTLAREFGRIDVLVNNAGISIDEPFLRAKKQHWDRMMAVNLSGVYHCCYAVVKTWAGAQFGSRIVNVSSVAGLRGLEFGVAYTASKAGIIGLTKALARELAPKNVTVNAVAPGYIEAGIVPEMSPDDYIRQTPMNRLGATQDVAQVVSFLVSSAAEYVTGEVIRVDGGVGM